jgi:hypothetical protein
MGDHITGARYLFFLGRGECLLLLAGVGDLVSTLPCVGNGSHLLAVGGCWGDSRGVFVDSRGLLIALFFVRVA